MKQEKGKQTRIKNIIDDAARQLESEGVKYFIGVVDRNQKSTEGGKAYAQSDITGQDFYCILDMALPSKQDIINLGIWVGQLISAREKGIKGQKKSK